MLGNNKKNSQIIIKENAKCCKCGKKIRKGSKYSVLEGKLYCEKCARDKKDWEFLMMMALLDD